MQGHAQAKLQLLSIAILRKVATRISLVGIVKERDQLSSWLVRRVIELQKPLNESSQASLFASCYDLVPLLRARVHPGRIVGNCLRNWLDTALHSEVESHEARCTLPPVRAKCAAQKESVCQLDSFSSLFTSLLHLPNPSHHALKIQATFFLVPIGIGVLSQSQNQGSLHCQAAYSRRARWKILG